MNSEEEREDREVSIRKYIGPGFGLIGGTMLLLASFIFFSEYTVALPLYPLLIVPEILTPIIAISSIISSLIIIIGNKIGRFLLFLVGSIAVITFLTPIQTVLVDGISLKITLSGAFMIIDPFLVFSGGLISLWLNK
jgi:hypothetical protein